MKELDKYFPTSEKEIHYKKKMLALYSRKSLLAFSRNNLEAHFTASAWILNPTTQKVLLLHHKKLNKWLQPGGHADGQTDLEKVARKEAYEETSLTDFHLITSEVFDIDIHTIPERNGTPQHEHFDVRFTYFCTDKEKTTINSESNDFCWIKLNEVKTITKESSIWRMVGKSKALIDGI